jgi:hypothetical protein
VTKETDGGLNEAIYALLRVIRTLGEHTREGRWGLKNEYYDQLCQIASLKKDTNESFDKEVDISDVEYLFSGAEFSNSTPRLLSQVVSLFADHAPVLMEN